MASAKELQQKGNMAVAKGDMVGAVRFLTEAISIDSSMDSLYSNRAYAYAGLGRHEDALKDAHTCIDLNPASSKGYLRAGRALVALGRAKEASVMLDEALEAHPQDYGLQEALQEAMAKLASGGGASDGSASAAAAAESAAIPAPQSAKPDRPGGLDSSYYYAAVPVSERKLPVQAPPKIASEVRVGEATPVANGKIKDDIERKGPDNSYYYAHDRKTDYTVPTVPQKLNSDGSMTAWDGK